MAMLELSFLSESSEPFCTQFMKLTSLQIQCFPAAFPCETSHKSLVFIGHCLLVATLFSYLISFYKGIRLSPERSCLWGRKDFVGLSKNNTMHLPPRSPSCIHSCIFLYFAYEFELIAQLLLEWRILTGSSVCGYGTNTLLKDRWRVCFWSGCLVGGLRWYNP